MKEIKFRIWDKKKKRWFQGSTDERSRKLQTDSISLFGEVIMFGEILRDQNDDKTISLDRLKDLEAVQFTGLKDKNGKDIYEGDIIVHWTGDVKAKPLPVVWEKNCFWLTGEKGSRFWPNDVEIIGNIYENKVLLN